MDVFYPLMLSPRLQMFLCFDANELLTKPSSFNYVLSATVCVILQ